MLLINKWWKNWCSVRSSVLPTLVSGRMFGSSCLTPFTHLSILPYAERSGRSRSDCKERKATGSEAKADGTEPSKWRSFTRVLRPSFMPWGLEEEWRQGERQRNEVSEGCERDGRLQRIRLLSLHIALHSPSRSAREGTVGTPNEGRANGMGAIWW